MLYGSMAAVMYAATRLYMNDNLTIGALATFLVYLSMFVL